MAEDYVSIVGTLEKILYNNPESSFIIGTFITENSFKNEEFLKEFAKMNKTVKNGVDTSLSNSNNNSREGL